MVEGEGAYAAYGPCFLFENIRVGVMSGLIYLCFLKEIYQLRPKVWNQHQQHRGQSIWRSVCAWRKKGHFLGIDTVTIQGLSAGRKRILHFDTPLKNSSFQAKKIFYFLTISKTR